MGHPFGHYFLISDSRRTISISLSDEKDLREGGGGFYLNHVSVSHVVRPLHRTEVCAARHSGGCEDAEGGEAGGKGEGGEGGGGW